MGSTAESRTDRRGSAEGGLAAALRSPRVLALALPLAAVLAAAPAHAGPEQSRRASLIPTRACLTVAGAHTGRPSIRCTGIRRR
jgi:hypothetical protein